MVYTARKKPLNLSLGSYEKIVTIVICILSITALTSLASIGHQALEITGFVVTQKIREGEQIHLAVTIVNRHSEAVRLSSIKVIPDPKEPCPSFSPPTLKSNETLTFVCKPVFEKEGNYNVGLQVLWSVPKAEAPQQGTSIILSQVTVQPNQWYKRTEIHVIAAVIFLVAIIILVPVWRKRRQFTAFQVYLLSFMVICAVILARGLIAQISPMVITGLLGGLLLIVTLIMGENYLRDLMNRLVQIGSIKFSPPITKQQELGNVWKRKEDFIKRETSIEQIIIRIEEFGDYPTEFLRLTSYSLESALAPYSPSTPPNGMEERCNWLSRLQSSSAGELDEKLIKDLNELYVKIKKYENFKRLFFDSLKRSLEEAQASRDPIQGVRDVIAVMEESKNTIICPHFFTTVAGLHVILKNDERALAALYEGQSCFPDSLNTNIVLGWYIGNLNSDFLSPVKYEERALEIAREWSEGVHDCYSRANSLLLRCPENTFTRHLKEIVNDHQDRWKKKLLKWIDDIAVGMRNHLAYNIAIEGIVERRADAIEYAKIAVEAQPKNPAYIDTLGLVKLAFAYTATGAQRTREIEDAVASFDQATYWAVKKDDQTTLAEARLHRQQAIETLGRT